MQELLANLRQRSLEEAVRTINLFAKATRSVPDPAVSVSSDSTNVPGTTLPHHSHTALSSPRGVSASAGREPRQPSLLTSTQESGELKLSDGADDDTDFFSFVDPLDDSTVTNIDILVAAYSASSVAADVSRVLNPNRTSAEDGPLVVRWGPCDGREVVLQRFAEPLGRGGAAAVYPGRLFVHPATTERALPVRPPDAADCELVLDVAVKVFRNSMKNYPNADVVTASLTRRFAVCHPGIVSSYFCALFPTDPMKEKWLPDMSNVTSFHLGLAMECANGGTVGTMLRRKERLSEAAVRAILRDLLPAVRYLHEEVGIVHNDIKPMNILVFHSEGTRETVTGASIPLDSWRKKEADQSSSRFHVVSANADEPNDAAAMTECYKLSDFEAARSISRDALAAARLLQLRHDIPLSTYRKAAFLGTATHMSPESCLGISNTPTNDIWSIGVTTFQLLTGRTPWRQMENAYPPIIINGFREKFTMGCLFANDSVASKEDSGADAPAKTVHVPGSRGDALSRFGPLLDEIESSDYSPDARDFVKACLVEEPQKRPTCAQLMEHPFMRSTMPST